MSGINAITHGHRMLGVEALHSPWSKGRIHPTSLNCRFGMVNNQLLNYTTVALFSVPRTYVLRVFSVFETLPMPYRILLSTGRSY